MWRFTLRYEVGFPAKQGIFSFNQMAERSSVGGLLKFAKLTFWNTGGLSQTGGVYPVFTNPATQRDISVTLLDEKLACTAEKSTYFLQLMFMLIWVTWPDVSGIFCIIYSPFKCILVVKPPNKCWCKIIFLPIRTSRLHVNTPVRQSTRTPSSVMR